MRKQADFSLFSSIARCSNVWRQPSGPWLQLSVSQPRWTWKHETYYSSSFNKTITAKPESYRQNLTRMAAMSVCAVSSACHSGQSPSFASRVLTSAPFEQRDSTTLARRFAMASCSGVRCPSVLHNITPCIHCRLINKQGVKDGTIIYRLTVYWHLHHFEWGTVKRRYLVWELLDAEVRTLLCLHRSHSRHLVEVFNVNLWRAMHKVLFYLGATAWLCRRTSATRQAPTRSDLENLSRWSLELFGRSHHLTSKHSLKTVHLCYTLQPIVLF